MKRTLILLVAGLALGSSATAAVGWRVFASATDKGEYGTLASVSASTQNPNAVAFRVKGTGGPFEVSWYFVCEGEARPAVGQIVTMSPAAATKCEVHATADSDKAGTLRMEILRR